MCHKNETVIVDIRQNGLGTNSENGGHQVTSPSHINTVPSRTLMKLLDRYIFREILIPSLIGLLALTFVFLSHDIGRLLEVIVRQSATASELWQITVAALPNVLTFTIPMAVLVGILTGFGRMSSDSEAIAFRAAGVSML